MRWRLSISGRVQGVGFRPFVFRLARDCGLAGWVRNSAQGAEIECEGPPGRLERFTSRLEAELPPPGWIRKVERRELPPLAEAGFAIRGSCTEGAAEAEAMPDLALCADCLAELRNPVSRRYRYPFTSCTRCGPRFTIQAAIPFERENSAMRAFPLCRECLAEFQDPSDRRFHAQTQCCPACGPRVELRSSAGERLAEGDGAIRMAGEALRGGKILAAKGIGGFHLLCDAGSSGAVARLREAKARPEKPFALLVRDLGEARKLCLLSPFEEELLSGPGAPIVLAERRAEARVAEAVAPGLAQLGLMRAYSPLHVLLLDELPGPVVATSGNRVGEPLCTGEEEAFARLSGMADLFLVHDRAILARADDSVVREIGGEAVVLRAGRGFAPVFLEVEAPETRPLIALGAQQKISPAFGSGRRVVLWPHLGDLGSLAAVEELGAQVETIKNMYSLPAARLACDRHPDYASTRLACEWERGPIRVQHHEAHLLAVVAERSVRGPALGVAWDGTGYGGDGTLWGGEFFLGGAGGFRHRGGLRPFRLPGGEAAVREPRRVAFALLHECLGDAESVKLGFSATEARTLARMLATPGISPLTSSVGRLFDAVAALLGVRQRVSYEGQAALELEALASKGSSGCGLGAAGAYPMPWMPGQPGRLDWEPLLRALLSDLQGGVGREKIAARFHRGLAGGIVGAALEARDGTGVEQVVLGGGCFQNRLLTEWALEGLAACGFRVWRGLRVPPNDGGIALGQVMGGRNVLVDSG